ncbi:MAG: SAM-dependent methyltransferase [Phenylobacterium sp.]|nr:SAM-dependent methyltransferase [Phenylobacterium sp.]
MSDTLPDGARTSPATARNRQPILEVLQPRLPAGARVLEVASGAGEHAVFLAEALPGVRWQPSDRDDEALASIAAWRTAAGLANLAPPLRLDAADLASWPEGPFEAVVCINMIHISPWAACEGLVAGAGRLMTPGGRLFLYGPFLAADVETAPSNLAFDQSLKARDPAWGLRDLAAVTALAGAHGLALAERIGMPANNLIVMFEKA